MTKLIIIRHGYSTNNASGRYTGQLDAPLDALGQQQAEQLAAALCALPRLDALYASDLCRAADTLRPTAKRLTLPLHTDSRLRELNVGLWTDVPYEEVKERYADDFRHYLQSVDAPCTGGESTRKACERILAALTEIAERHEGETVAVCTHALGCRLAACLADGKCIEDVMAYKTPPNASYTCYAVEAGCFTALSAVESTHLETPTQTSKQGFV